MKKLFLFLALLFVINVNAQTPEDINKMANDFYESLYNTGFIHALDDSYWGLDHYTKSKGISSPNELIKLNHGEYIKKLPYLDPMKILRNIRSSEDFIKYTIGEGGGERVSVAFPINFIMEGYKAGAKAANDEDRLLLPDELLFEKCTLYYADVLKSQFLKN